MRTKSDHRGRFDYQAFKDRQWLTMAWFVTIELNLSDIADLIQSMSEWKILFSSKKLFKRLSEWESKQDSERNILVKMRRILSGSIRKAPPILQRFSNLEALRRSSVKWIPGLNFGGFTEFQRTTPVNHRSEVHWVNTAIGRYSITNSANNI